MGDALEEFTAFAAARQQSLGRMAFLLTGDHHEAEDLVQIALARTYLTWDRIRDKQLVEAYARRIIVNEHTRWWRRAWRRREHLTDRPPETTGLQTTGPPESAGPEDGWADRDEVWQAIRRLPPKQRAVIVLRYYEDLTEAETAYVLDVAVGTVKSQANSALRKLRSLLSTDITSPHRDPLAQANQEVKA